MVFRPPGLISAALIVRDEARMLPACLESLRGIADEVIVVDTGSMDGTPDIARNAGAEVVCVDWPDSFAVARNVGLERCHGEWALVIDADERLEDPEDELRRLAMDTGIDGIRIRVVNLTGRAGMGPRRITTQLRLVRLGSGARYEGNIHEQLVGVAGARIADARARLIHHGYREEVVRAKGKRARNGALLERQEDEPFHLFNRGNEQLFHGDPAAAAATYERCLEALGSLDPLAYPWGPALILGLVRSKRTGGAPAQAAITASAWLTKLPDHTDLAVEWALALAEAGDVGAGLVALDRALAMGDGPAHYGSTPGLCGPVGRTLRAQLLLTAGRRDEAIYEFRAALREGPHHLSGVGALAAALLASGVGPANVVAELEPVAERNLVGAAGLLATALLEAGAVAEAEALFDRLLTADPGNAEARLGLAESALSRADIASAAAFCADEAPGAGEAPALARCALFCALVSAEGDSVPGLLERASRAGLATAELDAFRAWHASEPTTLDDAAARAAAALLGAAIKLEAFESCDILHRLVALSRLEPAEKGCVLAEPFLAAGYLDIATDALMHAIETAGPSAALLGGLARVALARGLSDEAAHLVEEARRLDPADSDSPRVMEVIA